MKSFSNVTLATFGKHKANLFLLLLIGVDEVYLS